ncbi:hypothetical protein GCM10011584_09610 [Nocardioides phosphati]|uniref:Uncharacterized protein n=1 Tax=Nocardioides phosphati TaxID=1867775 RepID=A0ABQ2N8I5_9ACTN|nr:hypothetical protein [Nocardioides phosphati]GGO86691.1 hypothetical protein GCM10011584_09610 [Nocardioides phosphati]
MIRKPTTLIDGHLGRLISTTGVLVGVIPRPNGAGADITIRLNAGDDIEIHKEKS